MDRTTLLEGVKSTFCGIVDIYGALININDPDKQAETGIPLQEEVEDKTEMGV